MYRILKSTAAPTWIIRPNELTSNTKGNEWIFITDSWQYYDLRTARNIPIPITSRMTSTRTIKMTRFWMALKNNKTHISTFVSVFYFVLVQIMRRFEYTLKCLIIIWKLWWQKNFSEQLPGWNISHFDSNPVIIFILFKWKIIGIGQKARVPVNCK